VYKGVQNESTGFLRRLYSFLFLSFCQPPFLRRRLILPAHASLRDVIRTIRNDWQLSDAMERLKRLELLEPASRSL